jgi:hypothetical protein
MTQINKMVAIGLLPVLLIASPSFAQQARVVDSAAMTQALAGQADLERSQRELVRRVLGSSDARELASRLGLSVERADSAVATLSGAELNTLAQQAGAVDTALAGGSRTIVISTTTLLLVLIIVILLVK